MKKAERRADGCEFNGPHSRQSLMHSLNLARDHEAALLAERDALRKAVKVLGKRLYAVDRILEHLNEYGDEEEMPHHLVAANNMAAAAINANPIASAAIAGEETA